MSHGSELTDFEKGQIFALRNNISHCTIANQIGRSKTVQECIGSIYIYRRNQLIAYLICQAFLCDYSIYVFN